MLLAVILINIITQCGFGLSPVVIKKFAALSGVNPLIFCLYRDILAFPLLLLVSRILEKKIIIPSLMQIPVLFALGFFGAYAHQLMYIHGLYRAGPNVATALANTIPVWALLLGMLCKLEIFDRKKLYSWLKIAGITSSVAGAIEIILSSGLNAGEGASVEGELPVARSASEDKTYPQMFIGCLFLLGSSSVMALHLVLQKLLIQNSQSKLMENWNGYPMNVMAWSYGIGTLCYGLSSLYYVYKGEMEVFRIPPETAYSLAFTVTITSVTCFLCLTWANYHSSPTLVSAFWPVQVVVTMVSAYFITGDLLYPVQFIGVVLVVAGLFTVVCATHKETHQEVTSLVS